MDNPEFNEQLAQFTGTEQYHQGPFGGVVYTDGCKFFFEHAGGGAYWLRDILTTNHIIVMLGVEFAAITVTVKGDKCKIVANDGDGGLPELKEHIPYTDCPDGEYKFYMIQHVLLLASEY